MLGCSTKPTVHPQTPTPCRKHQTSMHQAGLLARSSPASMVALHNLSSSMTGVDAGRMAVCSRAVEEWVAARAWGWVHEVSVALPLVCCTLSYSQRLCLELVAVNHSAMGLVLNRSLKICSFVLLVCEANLLKRCGRIKRIGG